MSPKRPRFLSHVLFDFLRFPEFLSHAIPDKGRPSIKGRFARRSQAEPDSETRREVLGDFEKVVVNKPKGKAIEQGYRRSFEIECDPVDLQISR
jgi:hypothetical protein